MAEVENEVDIRPAPASPVDHPDQGFGTLEGFKKHLICPSCKKKLRDPKTLPCLHSFCNECLGRHHELQRQQRQQEENEERNSHDQQEDVDNPPEEENNLEDPFMEGDLADEWHTIPSDAAGSASDFAETLMFNHNPDLFSCPVEDCDGVTSVSLSDIGGLDNIQVNLPLSNIERTVTLKEDLPRGRVLCGACEQVVAIGVCFNKKCGNRPFCGECLEIHLRERRNEKHQIAYPKPAADSIRHGRPSAGGLENADDNQNIDNDIDNEWVRLQQCNLTCPLEGHEDHFMDMYCTNHDRVICLRCANLRNYHLGCSNVSTDEIYPECHKQTKEKLDKVVKLHKLFEGALITTQALEKALSENFKEIKKSINKRYDELEAQLQTERDELVRKAGRLLELKSRELDEHSKLLKRVSDNFSQCIDVVNGYISTLLPFEFMMRKTHIDSRLDELLLKYTDYHRTPLENDQIYFKENASFNTSGAIGCVFSTPSTKKFLIHPCSTAFYADRPSYFEVTARDIIRTEISLRKSMPALQATIRHLDDESYNYGVVSFDHTNGRYMVMIYPHKSGKHELCIYEPLRPPYDRCYIGGKRLVVTVHRNYSFIMPVL